MIKFTKTMNALLCECAHEYTKCEAHGLDHILSVYQNAQELCSILEERGVVLDREVVEAAALLHDTRLDDRARHHILASQDVLNRRWKAIDHFSDERIALVAKAVREHRASFTGDLDDIHSQVVSCADRGKPKELDGYLERAYKYHRNLGCEPVKAMVDAIVHIKDKFGSEGYATKRLPPMYMELYGAELRKFLAGVDSLPDRDDENMTLIAETMRTVLAY